MNLIKINYSDGMGFQGFPEVFSSFQPLKEMADRQLLPTTKKRVARKPKRFKESSEEEDSA